MILSPSGAFAGVGFAVPVDTVRRSVNQILRHGRVARAGLGVSVFHGSEGAMGLPGVLVMVVPPQSEAQRAGLRGTVQDARTGQTILGDVITEVDGTAVRGTEDLLNLLESKAVGQTVELTVQRGTMLAATRRVRLRLQDVGPTD
jgi:S1-C subfamily serine protease